jgi:hypothetical protein
VDVHPPTVTVTLYVPLIAVVALALVGFCVAFAKAAGPVHEYVAPVVVDGVLVKFNVKPSHIGELLDAVIVGIAFTVTVPDPVTVQPFESVTVKLNVFVPAGNAAVYVGAAIVVLFKPVPVHTYVYVGVPPAGVAVIVDVSPTHIVVGLDAIVTVGFAFIVIAIGDRGPSQFGAAVNRCDTYHVVVPAVVVGGVGAVPDAVPPEETVYHCNV